MANQLRAAGAKRFSSDLISMKQRQYQSSDLSRIIEIYTASIRTLATAFYTSEQIAAWAPIIQDEARWRDRLSKLHTVVVESAGYIAGFASYTDDGYLDFLFTHPAFARRGIGSTLYQNVESALVTLRVPAVRTHASLAARMFFDRHGFRVDAEECVECRGVYLRRFAMHKPLI